MRPSGHHTELSWHEISTAAHVGVLRNVEALRHRRPSRLSCAKEAWERHVLGALGELAFSKIVNTYWTASVNTFKSPDCGACVQVRTRADHAHDLIVRDDDRDNDVYVLITGGPQEFVFRGWISGVDAKQPQYQRNYGGHGDAYFVPASDLNPADTFSIGDYL